MGWLTSLFCKSSVFLIRTNSSYQELLMTSVWRWIKTKPFVVKMSHWNSWSRFNMTVHQYYLYVFPSCCLKLSMQSPFISRSPSLAAKNQLNWTRPTKIQFWRFPKDTELHLMTRALTVWADPLMKTSSVCQERGALMRHTLKILHQPVLIVIPKGTVKMVTQTPKTS